MKRKELELRQAVSALGVCMWQKRRWGNRLDRTKQIFGKKVFAVDLHSHSTHSDGCGTIADNYKNAMERARLDFLFCSDHSTMKQKRDVAKFPHAGLAMESHSGRMDVGLLLPRASHKKDEDLVVGVASARKIADFVWIAHPVGFDSEATAVDAAFDELLPIDDLAMEVMNGFTYFGRGYPLTGKLGSRLFDRLLVTGKKVTPIAAGDSHGLLEMGNCWTGVYASKLEEKAICRALNKGVCFASEMALLDFTCNGKRMSSELRVKKGDALVFKMRVADAGGLSFVRVISNGKVIKEYRADDHPLLEAELTRKARAKPAYYRIEVISSDARRAFSAPIYVRP